MYWQLIVRQRREWRVYCYITEEGARTALKVMRARGARCFIRQQRVFDE